MENKKEKKPKKKPEAYLVENGVRKELVVPKRDPNKHSGFMTWIMEHPNFIEIIDEKAVMK